MRLAIVFLGVLGLLGQSHAASIELKNPHYHPLLPGCLTLAADDPTSFWIVLHPEGATDIVGARFRVSGLPPDCSTAATPSTSAVVSEGDLFSTTGAEIAFASPQTEPAVLLYEVTLSCSGPVLLAWGYVTLQPDGILPATPGFECPVVITADTPVPSFDCARYTTISNHPLGCEIAVQPTTWSVTKTLYQ